MAVNAKEKAIRDFIHNLESGEVDGALSFFADDCEWITNEGTFRGKGEIESYLKWMKNVLSNVRFYDDGVGILVEGDSAIYQHVYEGSYEGRTIHVRSICTYKFSGDKCIYHISLSDRLAIAHQAAGALPGLAVNTIIRQVEKGLHK